MHKSKAKRNKKGSKHLTMYFQQKNPRFASDKIALSGLVWTTVAYTVVP